MKKVLFIILLFTNQIFSQIGAVTENGQNVVLFENKTWTYKGDFGKTLSEQYDDYVIYAREKLDKNIYSYNYSEKQEALNYIKEQIELKGYISQNKTLSEQYDEVTTYLRDKLYKNIYSYNYSEKQEALDYSKKLIESKGYLNRNKSISEQYDEVTAYVRDKLGKNIYSYDYSEKQEAKEYINKLMNILK